MNSNEKLQVSKMPTLYIPHGGGPCFFMEWTMGSPNTWEKMATWFRGLSETLPQKPGAIVVISGHWEEPSFSVYKHEKIPMLYDYYGFPESTYRLQYPASGSAKIASNVEVLLENSGFKVNSEYERGFDHGVFVPLMLMFPDADVPVIPLSLKVGLNPEEHIVAGQALESLRSQGVLILGSGNSYHNLRGMMSGQDKIAASDIFDDWLTAVVEDSNVEQRNQKLIQWSLAPAARSAHPREEHLIPLMVMAGAGGANVGKRIFTDRVMGSTVSAYQFG
ncbi:MAG: dioxygenase [Spirochaetia bacterium]|nr:dioxygenase [Spirochaetia bacterium]